LQPFHRSWRRGTGEDGSSDDVRDPVVLWTDTFTDGMTPGVARAAVTVLTDAGFRVIVSEKQACCGLTWISTGQLDGARARLRRLLDVLGPYAEQGIPIVGLEPSCTAVLRSDLLDLLRDDPRATTVSKATRTLAEVLTARPGWRAPDLFGVELVVQPHCHHHSVMSFAADQALLTAAGATTTVVSGCCGLAGNFGMQRGHYEMSVAVAENALLPAIRARPAESIVLADGFSCRTQVEQLAGLKTMHLAELLAERIDSVRR
jgi:Fe-S oxidoreductase